MGAIKPNSSGTWPHTLHWPLLNKFSSPRYSGVWARVIQAWRVLSPKVEASPPTNYDEVLGTNLWWTNHYFGHNFGASVVRAGFFAYRGICQIADIWDQSTHSLLAWQDISQRFQLPQTDRHIFDAIHRHFPGQWLDICQDTRTEPKPGEWVGVFDHDQDEVPHVIFQTSEQFRPRLSNAGQIEILAAVSVFKPGTISSTLVPKPVHENRPHISRGIVRRI